MIDAAFDTASRLFGLKFKELKDAPRYHPDVRVWEVTTKAGEPVGVFLGDYYARPSKRSGAWMSSFRAQHKLGKGSKPVIVNVLNFARGAEGQPTLLSIDDARTLFHEFGHGLHGLLSDVTYPTLSGTNVTRDFVELPSQLYEHWLTRPEVLKKFATHHKTGKPMPDNLIKRIQASRTFNQGFATAEYVASALVDMDLHALEAADGLDVGDFEKTTLSRLGHAARSGDAASHSALPAHHGRVCGGVLQLPVVGGDGRGCVRGLRGGGRHLRPQDGGAAQAARVLGRQPARSAGGVCRLPRPAAEGGELAQEAGVWGVSEN